MASSDLFWSDSRQEAEAEVARLVGLIEERAAAWNFEQCIVYRDQVYALNKASDLPNMHGKKGVEATPSKREAPRISNQTANEAPKVVPAEFQPQKPAAALHEPTAKPAAAAPQPQSNADNSGGVDGGETGKNKKKKKKKKNKADAEAKARAEADAQLEEEMRKMEELKEKKKAAPVKKAPVEEDSDNSDDDTEEVKASKAAAMLQRGNVLKDKGNVAVTAGDYELAIKHYSMAIRLCPQEHTFISNRSAAYLKDKQPKLALRDAKKCTEMVPGWAKGYSRLGASFSALDMVKSALAAYEKTDSLEPGNDSTIKQLEYLRPIAAQSKLTAEEELEQFQEDHRKQCKEEAGCTQQ